MARPKAKTARRRAATPAAPVATPAPDATPDTADLAAAKATLAALPEPALLTGEKWSGAGVEIIFANAAFAAMTGFPVADLIGRNTRIFHGQKTSLVAPRGADPRADAQRLHAGESWLYRKDGSTFYARWHFVPFVPGVQLAVYQDLSEVKRLQEALFHSQQLDTIGQLASGVAHELNNLLSIINGYAEILTTKLAATPARKDLGEIQRAGVKAAGISRQILEFSRRQENDPRVVNVNTLIREIADMLRRAMGEAVQVELRLASDLGNVRIDPTRFQQMLLNLCFNARDAMPGGGKLTVRTANHAGRNATEQAREKDFIRIEVTDTGTGFDADVRARIFEPFFTTKTHGTGLGLPTVLAIVREAEGKLDVRSQPGAGTTFEIFLPETPEQEQTASTVGTGLPATRGTEQLWLVEPDDVVRKMVSGILAVDGYRVREFSDIATALQEKSPAPDAVLLDVAAKNASQLAHHLLGLNPRLKLLAVSNKSPAAALPDFSPTAARHLPKPFALSTLLRTVRNLLDGV